MRELNFEIGPVQHQIAQRGQINPWQAPVDISNIENIQARERREFREGNVWKLQLKFGPFKHQFAPCRQRQAGQVQVKVG